MYKVKIIKNTVQTCMYKVSIIKNMVQIKVLANTFWNLYVASHAELNVTLSEIAQDKLQSACSFL